MNALKKWVTTILSLAIVVVSLGITDFSVNASGEKKVIITTQECSIWTRPNTSEMYRQKKIPAGHQVTVYTDVIASEKNDGKTFYKTLKGAYILCRCCDGNEKKDTVITEQSFTNPAIIWYMDQLRNTTQSCFSYEFDDSIGNSDKKNYNSEDRVGDFISYVNEHNLFSILENSKYEWRDGMMGLSGQMGKGYVYHKMSANREILDDANVSLITWSRNGKFDSLQFSVSIIKEDSHKMYYFGVDD